MLKSLFEIIGAGLKIWESKEKNKYIKEYLSLEKDYYNENSKPKQFQDHVRLDDIEFKLMLIGRAFAAQAGRPTTSDLSK